MSEQAEPLPQNEMHTTPLMEEGWGEGDKQALELIQDEVSILTDLFGGKMNTEQFKRVLEAALLTTTEPLPVSELKKLSDV